MKCPKCGVEIKAENLNVTTDVGLCQSCNHLFKISEHVGSSVADGFEVFNPPAGAWIRKEMDQLIIGATTRSPIAFFLVPFMVVWSGGALGGIYGTQVASGEFDPFMSLFGIPFLFGAILFWSLALMAIWGKVELTLDRSGGMVFTGVGRIGLKRRFTWDEISTISDNPINFRYPGSRGRALMLEGKKRMTFGMGVNSSRQYYLFRTLQIILSNVKAHKSLV